MSTHCHLILVTPVLKPCRGAKLAACLTGRRLVCVISIVLINMYLSPLRVKILCIVTGLSIFPPPFLISRLTLCRQYSSSKARQGIGRYLQWANSKYEGFLRRKFPRFYQLYHTFTEGKYYLHLIVDSMLTYGVLTGFML